MDPETPSGSSLFSPAQLTWRRRRLKGFAQWGAGQQGTDCPRHAESALLPPETCITALMNSSVYTELAKMSRSDFLFTDWKLFYPKLSNSSPGKRLGVELISSAGQVLWDFDNIHVAISVMLGGHFLATQGKEAFFQMYTCLQQTFSLGKGGKGKTECSSKGQSPWSDLIAGSDEYPWTWIDVLTSPVLYLCKEERYFLMRFHNTQTRTKLRKNSKCFE